MICPFSSRVPKTRQREGQVPFGWEAVYVRLENGEYVRYRCTSTCTCLDREKRRCTFFCRENKVPKIHAHRYALPHDLDPFFIGQDSGEIDSYEDANRKIAQLVAKLAGELDISVRKLAGREISAFCRAILGIGFSTHQQNPRLLFLPNNVRVSGRNVLTARLRQAGENQWMHNLTVMEDAGFVNVACDAGTVTGLHCLHSFATNPWRQEFPLLLDTYDCGKGYTALRYREFFKLTTEILLEKEIRICGVVTDNLSAQVKGLREWI